jgi:hypothetical protein
MWYSTDCPLRLRVGSQCKRLTVHVIAFFLICIGIVACAIYKPDTIESEMAGELKLLLIIRS